MSEQIETYYGLRLQVESMRKLYESARDGMRQLGSELESTRIRIAELETALAEARERWIQEREAWIAQKAECVTLREKLAEAEADSKRLDWLHARMAHVFEWTTGRFGVESRSGHDHWLVRPIYDTPRAAIDAARKGKP